MTAYESTYSAKVEHVSTLTTVLDDVQNVTIRQGRKNLSDTYKAAVMTIEGRNPADLPNIKIGDQITVTIEAFLNGAPVSLPSWESVRTGRVADIQINYGFVPSMDTWTITTEDAIAVLGRAAVDVTVAAGTVVSDAAKQITDAAGVTMTVSGSSRLSNTTVSATTFQAANALDAFQNYANTEMAFVVQQGDELQWEPRYGWTFTGHILTFSDEVPIDPLHLPFQGLMFGNLADTVAQEVVINRYTPLGNSVVTTGVGDTYISFNTFDETDAQALNLAQFIKALFTYDEPAALSLSYMFTGSNPAKVLTAVATELREIRILFRGNIANAIVLGYTISINPDVSRAQLDLLPIAQIPFLVLDSTINGVLDSNVLSY